MHRQILNERLTRLISQFAAAAMESRQVARRLSGLLPSRFLELKREHARGGAGAERLALTDARYLAYVDELVTLTDRAVRARIEYETHAMLYQARQTLRTVRR